MEIRTRAVELSINIDVQPDAPPRNANSAGFLESDRLRTLDLPQSGPLPAIAKSIESAMRAGKTADVRRACLEFLAELSGFYRVPSCGVRVLAADLCESVNTG